MQSRPIPDPRILEAIEACRPGSDDLADPAMAFPAAKVATDPELGELYANLQRVDATLVEAFHDLPVPEGLAERILGRLKAARAGDTSAAHPQTAADLNVEADVAPVAPSPDRRRRISRRRWLLVGAGSLAVAGSILVAVVVHMHSLPDYPPAAVREMAIDFFASDTLVDLEAKLVDEHPPPAHFPISAEVASVPRLQWRSIRGFLAREGVAYDLSMPGRPRATLYVVRRTVPGLKNHPPPRPELSSRNLSTSVWQSGPLLYVLVVEGGPRTYSSFLDLPRGPWT